MGVAASRQGRWSATRPAPSLAARPLPELARRSTSRAGSTGGGKVAGSGRRGLQGGSPPPPLKQDLGRLSAKQAGLREKAEQVAQKLDTAGVTSRRLKESIGLMKSVEKELIDGRYE